MAFLSLHNRSTAMLNSRKDDSDANKGISITPRAARRLQEIMQQISNPDLALRIPAETGGSHGLHHSLSLTNERNADDAVFSCNGETGEVVAENAEAKMMEGVEEGMAKAMTAESASKPGEQVPTSHKESLQVTAGMSSLSSRHIPARQLYLGSSSSAPYPRGEGQAMLRIQNHSASVALEEMSLGDVELSFLRAIARTRTPIAAPEDIQLDCVDRSLDTSSRHGATMQVHRGTWRGRKVAFKYIRRDWLPLESEQDDKASARAYRQDMYDLNFELQIMSKPSLREHPNITKLLAVCFGVPPEKSEGFGAFPEPGLIVEPAHERYPDLASFFNGDSHPERPHRLPYETGASLIADIADGVQVLHDHDLIHADLKPENILLFLNSASQCGLTAKITDFGFAGMVSYTKGGIPIPTADSMPRGGTPEWNAPECLEIDGPFDRHISPSLDHPQYNPSRDIYSFGLLTTYIALDGQSPKQYVQNLADVKLSGRMLEAAVLQVEQHYRPVEAARDRSLKGAAIDIVLETLTLDPQRRVESLRSLEIRKLLFNDTWVFCVIARVRNDDDKYIGRLLRTGPSKNSL
jgi:serine/threonine protein kinase/Fe-S cluster assembly iron-binding protein IscA